MSTEKVRADSMAFYLTGAGSHGGAQADPNLSLGNFRSSSKSGGLAFDIDIVDLGAGSMTVVRVAAQNGPGTGIITSMGGDYVAWTPPGGTQGPSVEIPAGQTRQLVGGGGAINKFIVLFNSSVGAMSGSGNVVLSYVLNNLFGFADASSAELTAGSTKYRCIAVLNESANTVTALRTLLATLGTQQVSGVGQLGASGAGTITTAGSFSDWPAFGWCQIKTNAPAVRETVYYTSRTATALTVPAAGRGLQGTTPAAGAATDTLDAISAIAIGLDAPTSQPSGSYVDNTGADEDTAPGGVTFTTPLTEAEALSIGTLTSLQQYGIWARRHIPAGAVSGTSQLQIVRLKFDAP